MKRVGLIGGTGLDEWGVAGVTRTVDSRYGQLSAYPLEYELPGVRVYFLPRHGRKHLIPPHAVNYRANVDSFRQLNVDGVIAVNASAHFPGKEFAGIGISAYGALSVIMAMIFLKEKVSPGQWAGLAMIVLGVATLSVTQN